jgi:glycogen operon protein
MVLGGDEIGRTQSGNNNAYCQDNEVSWYDWEEADRDLWAFVRTAIALRKANPPLRPRDYLRGPGGEPAQMVLYRPDGAPMSADDWRNLPTNTLAVALDGRQIEDVEGETSQDRFLLLLNAHYEPVDFTIPLGGGAWYVVLTSGEPDETPAITAQRTISVGDRSLLLLHSPWPGGGLT